MKKKLKILLSAYSCEPNTGSEHEVGWQWANKLVNLGHEVYVITRTSNKKKINSYQNNNTKKINFLYYDFPKLYLKFIKKKKNPNSYLYFILWQIGIYFQFFNFIRNQKFDYIHHVTFVSMRIPSLLCLFNAPFIFGPISGGVSVPNKLRNNFLFKEKFKEFSRDISNKFIKFSILMNLTFFLSKKIYVVDSDTKKFIPSIYHRKVKKLFGIGINFKKTLHTKKTNKVLNFCFIGNLISIKGPMIAIKIIEELSNYKKVKLEIFGDGILRNKIKEYIKLKKLNNIITVYGKIKQKILHKKLKAYNFILCTSLRDSGGLALLETLRFNITPIVFNLGGPGQIVNKNIGIKINTKNKNEEQLIKYSTKEILKVLNKDRKIRNINKYLIDYNWSKKVNTVYPA